MLRLPAGVPSPQPRRLGAVRPGAASPPRRSPGRSAGQPRRNLSTPQRSAREGTRPSPSAPRKSSRPTKPRVDWDFSTSDLSRYRLAPGKQLKMRLDRISPNLETAAQEYAAKLAAMKENLTPFLDKPVTPEPRRRPAPVKRTPEKASEERPARQLFQPPGRAGKVIGLADELSLLQGKPRRVGGDARKVGEAYSADTRPERKENTALTLRRLEAEVNRLTKRLELDTSAPSVAAFNAAEEEPETLHDSGVVE